VEEAGIPATIIPCKEEEVIMTTEEVADHNATQISTIITIPSLAGNNLLYYCIMIVQDIFCVLHILN